MTPVEPSVGLALDFLSGGGEMGDRIRTYDWSIHPLGKPEAWPQSLKTAVSLILNSQHPMWIGWGPEMSFLYNDAYLHVLGLAKHPWALGRPASEVWAEIWNVCGPLANKVFREGQASFMDDVRLFMNRGKFLEETYYSFSYSPIRDESGRVGGLFCPSNDVTPKVVGARRLRTLSELSSNALVEKTIEAACETAAETLSKNPDDVPFVLLYLMEAGQAVLKQTVGLDHPDDLLAPRVVDLATESSSIWPFAEVYLEGRSRRVSVRHFQALPRDAVNQVVSEAVVQAVVSHIDGKTIGVLIAGISPSRALDADYETFLELVARNVGTAIENAHAAEEERKRVEALAEIDRAKTAFFSNVSHEFRTPLTLMLGPIEGLLARESLGPENKRDLAIAHRNCLRLLKLVNSLLDFSRIEAGRLKAFYVPVDLAALTTDLVSNFRSAMEAAGLKLIVDCPPLMTPVYADREMWEKIVLNLLSNAFKFTLQGSVTVQLRERDGQAILRVTDTGVGIPESELPHLFERFHRVENVKGRTFEGTGIGLALVQELVRMHGGAITVKSELGKGSAFCLEIPCGSSHLPPDRVATAAVETRGSVRAEAYVEEALRWLPANDGSSSDVPQELDGGQRAGDDQVASPNQAGQARVLLAEDNTDMRDYIVRLLRNRMQVTAVSDGREALTSALQEPPDLVLSDVMMPLLDGFGLLRELRADPSTRSIPVILLSARAGEESRIEGISAGADDYLVKPFSAEELLARVTAHLKLARLRQENVATMRRLQEISTRLIGESDLATLLGEFLDAAIEITRADMGNVQLLDPATGELTIAAQRGFDAPFVEFFNSVREGEGACTAARRQGTRVIVEDVATSPVYNSKSREAMLEAGARAVQSTPFIARSGKLLGMFSTHFRAPHRPSDRELQLLDVLARQGADLIERELAEEQLRRNNAALADNVDALTRMHALSTRLLGASGLGSLLQEIMDAAVAIVGANHGTLQLIEDDSLRIVAHHGHQQPFLTFFANAETRDSVCDEAMRLRGRVVVEDVEESSLFAGSPSLPVLHAAGVRAVQSTPLFSRSGKMLGILTTHWSVPHFPSEHDLWRIDLLVRQAADLIEHAQAEAALHDSEHRFRFVNERAEIGYWDWDIATDTLEWSVICKKLFGLAEDERMSYARFLAAIHPEDRERTDQAVHDCLDSTSLRDYDIEYRTQWPNGSVHWIRAKGSAAFENGRAVRMAGIAINIDAHKRDMEALRASEAQLQKSEERFRALVTATSDAVYRMSPDWTEMRHLAGRGFVADTLEPSQTWLGKYIHPDDQPHLIQTVQEAIRRKSVLALEHRIIRADGTLGWTFSRAVPILNGTGEIVEWFGAASDITDLKAAEEALRQSEKRFRDLAEVGPQIVWLSGSHGELEFVNRRWVEFSGMDLEATMDPAQIARILHPEDHLLDHWNRAVATGTPFELEARLRGKDGEFRWFMMRSIPVSDAQGRIQRWFGTSTDIHENKLLQLELRRANQDLEQFAYSASHDLQEPVRSVKIFSELLSDRYAHRLDGNAHEFLGNVQEGAGRMEMLVRDLLAYTQITRVDMPPEMVDANAAVRAALANLAGAVSETGATIQCDSLPRIRVHATQLQQLFQNLIGNAIKYHRPGVPPVVHIAAGRKNGAWVFSIEDNGIGIEPQYKEKIFGLFKRLHTHDEYSGTGIGLAICQRIVERHHGRIWVESEPREGSTFYFTLPR